MTRTIARLGFGFVVASVAVSCNPGRDPLAGPATPPPPTAVEREVETLVEQLAGQDAGVREAAAKRLRELGWQAVTPLVIARNQAQREVRGRINEALETIVWAEPSLDAQEQRTLAALKADPGQVNQGGFGAKQNPRAYVIARRAGLILESLPLRVAADRPIEDRDLQRERFAVLKESGNIEQLEWELMGEGLLPDLLFVLRDRPADAERLLRAIESLRPATRGAHEHKVTWQAALARAYGDPTWALQVAQAVGAKDSVLQALAEREDWAALSRFRVEKDFFNVSRFVPAGAMHFLGRTAEGDALIAGNSRAASGVEPVGLQRQVVLLGRQALMNAACRDRKDADQLVELLLLQRRYAAAMAMHSKPGAARAKGGWTGGTMSAGGVTALGPADAMEGQLDSRLLGALLKLNERTRAGHESTALHARGVESPLLNSADLQMGYTLGIQSRIKRAMASARWSGELVSRITRIFGKDRARMARWVTVIGVEEKDVEKVVEKAVQLWRHQLPAEEIMRLAERSAKPVERGDPWEIRSVGPLYLAAAAELEQIGAHQLAAECLEKHFASVATAKRGWRSASQPVPPEVVALKGRPLLRQFLQWAAAVPGSEPALLFLAGAAEAAAGEAQAGARLMERANARLGGNIGDRMLLAQALLDLGEEDLAVKQAETVTQIDFPVSGSRYAAHVMLAHWHARQGRFAEALLQHRLAYYAQFYEAITIPEDYEGFYAAAVHRTYCEAQAAAARNEQSVAVRAGAELVALDPEAVHLVSAVLQSFRRNGWEAQAKERADAHRKVLEEILRDFPDSHLHHALAAKLDVESGYISVNTIAHARRAVALVPENQEYAALLRQAEAVPAR